MVLLKDVKKEEAGKDPVLVPLMQSAGEWLTRVAFKRSGKNGSTDKHLDWHEVMDSAEKAGVEYAVVELEDKTADLIDDAKASHEFFSRLGVGD